MKQDQLQTKFSELAHHKRTLYTCGFIVPPLKKICCPYDGNKVLVENKLQEEHLDFLERMSWKYSPVIAVRNNGIPQGAGIGETRFIDKGSMIAPDISQLLECYKTVRESDPKADGAIFQQYAGMEIYLEDKMVYAPIISGIAYTSPCTRTGNSVIEWVFGHPKGAVEGKGNYFAFDSPEAEFDLCSYARNSEVYALKWRRYYPELDMVKLQESEHNQFLKDHYEDAEKIFRSVVRSIFELGKHSAFYLEWAGVMWYSKIMKFSMQISDFAEGTLAGLDNHTKKIIDEFPSNLNAALNLKERDGKSEISADSARLGALYEEAMRDPQVIAFGFDVVGKKRQVHKSMLICNNDDSFEQNRDRVSLFLIDPSSFYVNADYMKRFFKDMPKELSSAIGIAEIGSSHIRGTGAYPWNGTTFRGHMRGFFNEKGILGLSGTQYMPEKLFVNLSNGATSGKLKNAILRGEFILEADESLPFGTLRVGRIDSVEQIPDNTES